MLNLIYIAYLFVFGLFVCLFSLTNSPKVKAEKRKKKEKQQSVITLLIYTGGIPKSVLAI